PAHDDDHKVIAPMPRSNDLGGSCSGLGQKLTQIRSARPNQVMSFSDTSARDVPRTRAPLSISVPPIHGTAQPRMRVK
ncbi:hypothetical protein A2U01_0054948, partial [Trifolium medium]|nr:hypothetical protein [Trifolium medium]